MNSLPLKPQWCIKKRNHQVHAHIVRAFLLNLTLTKEEFSTGWIKHEDRLWLLVIDHPKITHDFKVEGKDKQEVFASFQQWADGTYWVLVRLPRKVERKQNGHSLS